MRKNNRSNYKKKTYTRKRNSRGMLKTNFAIARFKAPKTTGQAIKTLDCQYIGPYAFAVPFVQDQLQPSQIPITTTPVIQQITTVQQGPGISQRIGNKICLKSLRVRFDLGYVPANNVEITQSARFIVVYDRNPNGAYPTVNQILAANRQDGTTNNGTMWSSINCNLLDRFVILLDEFKILPPVDSVTAINGTWQTGPTNQEAFKIDKYIKLKGLETVFSNTANPQVIANTQVGALYIVAWGNVAQAVGTYTWVGETRLRFYDY